MWQNYCKEARDIALSFGNQEIVALMDKALAEQPLEFGLVKITPPNFGPTPFIVGTGTIARCPHKNSYAAGASCRGCRDCGIACYTHIIEPISWTHE